MCKRTVWLILYQRRFLIIRTIIVCSYTCTYIKPQVYQTTLTFVSSWMHRHKILIFHNVLEMWHQFIFQIVSTSPAFVVIGKIWSVNRLSSQVKCTPLYEDDFLFHCLCFLECLRECLPFSLFLSHWPKTPAFNLVNTNPYRQEHKTSKWPIQISESPTREDKMLFPNKAVFVFQSWCPRSSLCHQLVYLLLDYTDIT